MAVLDPIRVVITNFPSNEVWYMYIPPILAYMHVYNIIHNILSFLLWMVCYTINVSMFQYLGKYCLLQITQLQVPDFPKDPERGMHSIPLGPLMYIERSDFMEGNQKSFRRLTPEQPVGLKYTSSTISVQHVVKVYTPTALLCHSFLSCALLLCGVGWQWEGGGGPGSDGETGRHSPEEATCLYSLGGRAPGL